MELWHLHLMIIIVYVNESMLGCDMNMRYLVSYSLVV